MRPVFAIIMAIIMLAACSMSADVIDDLLRIPAPPPGEYAKPREQSNEAPADDAPLEVLVDYWTHPARFRMQPPAAVRERLQPDVCEREKQRDISDNVEMWLLWNCASERDALAAAAAKATDARRGAYVEHQEDVEALARTDWKRAEPVVLQLARSPHERTRALAQSLLYEHAPSHALRDTLQSIAADPAASGFARDRAIEALGLDDWEGRDAWLLERMSDPSLLHLKDGFQLYGPFMTITEADPEKWIPIMTGLLQHPNAVVRSNAANALGQFHLRDARADAMRPLIPWISDATWAVEHPMMRLRVIQSVAGLGLREAIPHLVQAVAHDPNDANRAYAAVALADFGDPGGNAAMREALRSIRGHNRELVLSSLIRTGGFTAQELADHAEVALSQNERWHETTLDLVVRNGGHRDDLAALLLESAMKLATTKPQAAREMIAIIETWPVPTADQRLMRRIETQQADAQTIATAVQRRADLRVTSSDGLHRLREMNGMRAGIAAVLIGDAMDQQRLLAGDDLEAQRALLAAARLAREPLPIETVAALFGRSPALDVAAEAWLIADDRPVARAIVQKRHPNEILILGHTDGTFAEWETELLRRFRASKDDEWIVLGSVSTWTPMTTVIEIRVRGGRATLSRQKFAALRQFLDEHHIDDLGPFVSGVSDGMLYEYLHLTRAGGRRVVMNYPDQGPHAQLVEMLNDLAENRVR